MSLDAKISLSNGRYENHSALIFSFETVSGEYLRSTKEYTLAYIPTLQEWHGDVIAYGEWMDLTDTEITELRLNYELDALVAKRNI